MFGLGPIGRDPLCQGDAFTIKDGAVRVPDGPGLGLVLDEAALERLTLAKFVVPA